MTSRRRFMGGMLAVVFAAASVAVEAAYVRGELVWKCDFTRSEAEAQGLAARKLAESGVGTEYAPKEGIAGDGAIKIEFFSAVVNGIEIEKVK